MLGQVISVNKNLVEVSLSGDLKGINNLINHHVVLEEDNMKVVGEIRDISVNKLMVILLGEIVNNHFISGVIKRPSISSVCRLVRQEELNLILGYEDTSSKNVYIGSMPLYDNAQIHIKVNDFLAHHFAVFGNTGSGKSCSVARIFQNIFYNRAAVPENAHIFIFDVYGEYHNAFSHINQTSPALNFKTYTTKTEFPDTEIIKIPLWLLGVDDIALLLGANNHTQIPIIEKALRLVSIFARDEDNIILYKNDIIARALMDILYSGNPAGQIRDQLLAILSTFNTKDLNLETKLVQPGYIRTLRQCFVIDRDGKLHEMQLLAEFFSTFFKDGLTLKLPDGTYPYTLNHLKDALDFALISEGVLKSTKVYDDFNSLKVRLLSLINSNYREYFQDNEYISKERFVNNIVTTYDGKKAQIINFNINYVDDRFAKVITKIYSKLLFDYGTSMENRGNFPMHIILEEAHRYVQNDNDINLLGYNIFDRITKEGRKYGIILGLISQRPSELSETSLSQCSNFFIFKMVHPKDTEYIRNMVPGITDEIVEKLKTLQPGNCVAFGSAFKIPVIIYFDMPNPKPFSSSADISKVWFN